MVQIVISIPIIAGLASLVLAQNINPPSSTYQFIKVQGVGTIDYTCQTNAWVSTNSAGDLVRPDINSLKVGSFCTLHDAYGGTDKFEIFGSAVTFKTNSTSFSQYPGTVPDVLYSATSTTPGTLEKVTFGQRLNASGGNAPTSSCNDRDGAKVPFRAEFTFYVQSPTAGSSLTSATNFNLFTGALLGVLPVKIFNNPAQTQPWAVINYDGLTVGSFSTRMEATTFACNIQRDECARQASDTQAGVKVQDCFDQNVQCIACQANAS